MYVSSAFSHDVDIDDDDDVQVDKFVGFKIEKILLHHQDDMLLFYIFKTEIPPCHKNGFWLFTFAFVFVLLTAHFSPAHLQHL